jgi:hypothetical protein
MPVEVAVNAQQPAKADPKSHERKLSHIGATEDEMDTHMVIPQRIDRRGTKVEDLAGTGQHDSAGG